MLNPSPATAVDPSRVGRGWQLAATASLLLFLIFQFDHALAIPPLTDDGWMASVAKNLAFGYGWSTSIGRIMPFDADITTGPALLLPLAAAIKLFGNAIWLPRIFTLCWNGLLLALLLWRLRGLLGPAHWWRMLVLLPMLYCAVHWHLWISSLGDVSAFLYTALGSVLLAEGLQRPLGSRGRRTLLVTGASSLALACLAKTVALVPAGCALLLLLPLRLSPQPPNGLSPQSLRVLLPQSLRDYARLLPVFVAPLLLWQAYQHQVLTALPAAERTLIEAKLAYNFAHTGSGLADLQQAWHEDLLWQHLRDTTRHNFQRYSEITGNLLNPLPAFFALFCAAVTATLLYSARAVSTPLRLCLLALSLPTVAYVGWAVCFGAINFGRFISLGLLLGLTSLACAIAKSPRGTIAACAWVLASLLLFSPQAGFYGFFLDWQPLPSADAQALRQVSDMLTQRYGSERLATCSGSFAREVEYALPVVNRIEDCTLLLGSSVELDVDAALHDERYRTFFAEAAAGVADIHAQQIRMQNAFMDARIAGRQDILAPVRWRNTPPDFIVVMNPVSVNFANFGRAANYRTITDACRETLYDAGDFRLLRCRGSDVRAAIEARGGIEFFPLQWQDARWLAEAATH